MTFQQLQLRLVEHLRKRIENGELTERRLARMTGISQPHIHNVLKGKKSFSPKVADVILAYLHIDVLDLFGPDEIIDRLGRR